MSGPLATNAVIHNSFNNNCLQTTKDGFPLQGQVPRTMEFYTGTGGETYVLQGKDVLVIQSTLSDGPLVISSGGRTGNYNLQNRVIEILIEQPTVNDITISYAPGQLHVQFEAAASNNYTFEAPVNVGVIKLICYLSDDAFLVYSDVNREGFPGDATFDNVTVLEDLTVEGTISGDLETTGSQGVFYDNGTTVSVTNDPTLGNLNVGGLVSSGAIAGPIIIAQNSLSTQALEANSFTLTSPLDTNNSETDILVRDTITGGVDVRELSSFPFLSNQTIATLNYGSSNYVLGNPQVPIQFMQTGRSVTLYIVLPASGAGNGTNRITLTPPPSGGFPTLPTRLEPINIFTFSVTVRDGTYKPGILVIQSNGVISIGLEPTGTAAAPGDLTDGQTRGMIGLCITYIGKP